MDDTIDLGDDDERTTDTPGEQPALQVVPRMLPVKAPTVQGMMLAQQERIAENVDRLDDDVIGWCASLARDLAEIKVTQRLFMRDVLIALGVIFALVVLALLARG